MQKIYFSALLFLFCFAGHNILVAQSEYNQSGTISRRLDSLTLLGQKRVGTTPNKRFSPGTKLIEISQTSIANQKMSTLADFIQQESASYLKEYGKGMGAFLSIRGTSSSHTTIAWNGQSLSVPTLGQTDFSHVPLYFFDAMDIHIGGNSALYGDGSIGGSIQLNTLPKWEKGFHGDVLLSAGSYRSFFGGSTFRYSNRKWESRTSFFQNNSKNDYTFKNNTKQGLPKERVNNSAANNFGVLQESFHKFNDSSILSFNLMYLSFDREIQPSVSSNDRPESYGKIVDQNFRMSANYRGFRNRLTYQTTLIYAHDKQEYKEDVIAAERLSATGEAEYSFGKFLMKVGSSATYTKPKVYSYDAGTKEVRANLFGFLRYTPSSKFVASLGARQIWVTDISVPFMPSFDIRATLFNHNSHTSSLRAAVSRNTKVPTLNDRYWGGNNLYLKSERSFTIETGIDYSFYTDRSTVDFYTTLYRSDVSDWIRWLPAGFVWRPQNIPRVLSKGVELGFKASRKIAEWKVILDLNYAYTHIRMTDAIWKEDPGIGEQLAYQPINSLRTRVRLEKTTFFLFLAMQYTGERTTVDIFDILPSYEVFDLGLGYQFNIMGYKCNSSLIIKNLFGKQYQNVKFFAMPGLNYQASFKWNF